MSVSFPSKRISIVDVPEVGGFRATFIYNFFTPDESLNDSGVAPEKFKRLPAESFDAVRIDETRRVIPRLVRFDFSRVMLHEGGLVGNEFVQRPNPANRLNEISIKKNLSQIQTESEFSSFDFKGLEFQDDNVDRKLFTMVSGSVAKRVASKNRSIRQTIDEDRATILDRLNDEHSLLDAGKALADETSGGVSDNLIVKAINQIDAYKLKLIDDATQQEIVTDTFARVKNISIRGQVSTRLVGRIIKNIVNDPMSVYADEFASIQKQATAIQSRSVARSNPNIIHKNEIEPTFNAIQKKPIDAHDFPSSTRIMGYIIEKHEVSSNGKLKTHPPIVIENPDVGTTVDTNVAYGKTYVYTIRTVAQLSVRATVEDSDDVVMGIGLISSRRSPKVIVHCIESVPPPSPTDFTAIWDYTTDAPFFSWSFPPNRQRDVKKFQVFRRDSINDPFQLIRQYDFDDSQIKAQEMETPDPKLVDKLTSPMTTYLDREFQKTSRKIYAVTSIDAHGFSSGYSMQFEVWFDVLKNRIQKRIVSYAGAPKSYPNMMLNQDLFSDSIKASGHTRVRVVFDPEFLNVSDAQGNDLRLITTENVDGGRYRMQLINTDLMEEEVIDITVTDMRPTQKR